MWASPYSSISWRERAQQRDASSKPECMRNIEAKSIVCLDGDTSSKASESNIGQKSEIVDSIPGEYVKCMSHPLNKGTMTVYDTHNSKCITHIDNAMKSCKSNSNNDCDSLIEKDFKQIHMCNSKQIITTVDSNHPSCCNEEKALSIFICSNKRTGINSERKFKKIESCVSELAYLNRPIVFDALTGECGSKTSGDKIRTVCEHIK